MKTVISLLLCAVSLIWVASAQAQTTLTSYSAGAGQGVAGQLHITGTELTSVPYVTLATNRGKVRYYRPGTPSAANNPGSISLSWNATNIDVANDSRLYGQFARSISTYRTTGIALENPAFYLPGVFTDIESGETAGQVVVSGDGLENLPYLWLHDTDGAYHRYANPVSAAPNSMGVEIETWTETEVVLLDPDLADETVDRAIGSVSVVDPSVINIDSGVIAVQPSGAPPAIGGDILLARTGDGSGIRQVVLPAGTTSIIFNDGSESFPIYSPDGSKILYRTGSSNGSLVRVRNADGTNPVTILTMTGNVSYSWMGNATVLVAMGGEIYSVSLTGTVVNLTNTPGSTESFPVSSPDGTKIAYQRSNNLYTMNTNGSAQTLIFSAHASQPPIWLTDSYLIAQRNGGAGNATIYRIPSTGGAAVQLGTVPTSQTRLALSSDNSVIAAVRSDLTGIVLIKNPLGLPVESTITTFAIPNQSEGMVTFSPNSALAYTTCDSGARICEYNIATSTLTNSWTYSFVLTALQWTGTRTAQ